MLLVADIVNWIAWRMLLELIVLLRMHLLRFLGVLEMLLRYDVG